MKLIRNITLGLIVTASFAACNSNRNSATLGNSQDTMNAVAGSNAGGTNNVQQADTSNNKNKSADTTSKGNVNPTGHSGNDTATKNHRPK